MDSNFIQKGGYKAKSYELNLFPNANMYNSREKNILMALSIGNIINFAKLNDSKKNIYKTCFPIKKVFCKFDPHTSLLSNSNLVIYNELFKRRKEEKILKLNLVTKITNDILSNIKKLNKESIKICL
jgi:hypothetical protein